jgi:hypothetical protein
MLYLKIHDNEHGAVIAMCDENLIGKVLDDGKLHIDLKQYAGFYKGELVNRKKALELMADERIYSANVIGKEAVETAIEGKVIQKENVSMVDGVPYAHAYKVDY